MMGAVEKLLEEHENRVERLNKRVDDPASGMTLGEYEDKLAALRAETAAKIAGSGPCEYCEASAYPEEWGEAADEGMPLGYRFSVESVLFADGHREWRLHSKYDGVDASMGISAPIDYCPKCGRKLDGDAE